MSTFWDARVNHPTGPEPGLEQTTMLLGLRAMREGDFAASQPRAFLNIMFHASLAGLITSRGARYFLTPKGRAFINGGEWSEST